ncbi:hypothetical protein [Actinoplanes aureus]|uniref:Secreted protein n=1 Tax=Actinoplanes aureus TaxID=2792083 RepID=A0A931CEY8_9ACTN|nr:hypothetical protein [Actinoplanes aureus]MBG0568655.1 hypothetical protein [Actinoplanes aureus]
MIRARRRAAFTAACALGTVLGMVPAAPALADPSGCRKDTTRFGVNTDGMLYATGEGNCGTRVYRVLEVEIKQQIDFQPDPVALKSSDAGSDLYYKASPTGCDNNQRKVYYGRTFFQGHTDYDDTSARVYDVC